MPTGPTKRLMLGGEHLGHRGLHQGGRGGQSTRFPVTAHGEPDLKIANRRIGCRPVIGGSCRFSNQLSCRVLVTCAEPVSLTWCQLRPVSTSCHSLEANQSSVNNGPSSRATPRQRLWATPWLLECLYSGGQERCPFGEVAIVGDAGVGLVEKAGGKTCREDSVDPQRR